MGISDRHYSREGSDNDDLDPEGPDEVELDNSDEPDLMPCPFCRKMLTEEAEQCQHCGRYLSEEESIAGISTTMVIIVAALVILGVLGWLVGR